MEALFVWQPVQLDATTVETVITPAESFKVGRGGPRFVQAVAEVLALPMPSAWTIRPFRSAFFTEIDDNWEDRWAIAWSLSMTQPPGIRLPDLAEGPRGLRAWDELWERERDDVNKAAEMECRVVADFSTEAQADAAAENLRRDGLIPRVYEVPRLHRVDVSLGLWAAADYPRRLPEAERVVGVCKAASGATKHLESYHLALRAPR